MLAFTQLLILAIVGFIAFVFFVSLICERGSRPVSWILSGGLAWECGVYVVHLWGLI